MDIDSHWPVDRWCIVVVVGCSLLKKKKVRLTSNFRKLQLATKSMDPHLFAAYYVALETRHY